MGSRNPEEEEQGSIAEADREDFTLTYAALHLPWRWEVGAENDTHLSWKATQQYQCQKSRISFTLAG